MYICCRNNETKITMKAITEKYQDLQTLANVIKEMNESNQGNYSVYFDENFSEVTEDEMENGEEFEYTERDLSDIQEMQQNNYDELVSLLKKEGFEVTTPQNDSIYITKDGENAISIRDHKVAQSTMMHWNSVVVVNIFTDNLSEKMLNEL